MPRPSHTRSTKVGSGSSPEGHRSSLGGHPATIGGRPATTGGHPSTTGGHPSTTGGHSPTTGGDPSTLRACPSTGLRRIVAAGLAGAACWACAEPGPSAAGSSPLEAAPERVLVETLRLGGVDAGDETAFQREPGLTVLPDGTLFVLHSERGRVAVFDADGSFVRWFGGQGQGPGEFTIASAIGRSGDTLWVRNFPEPRISRFLPDGSHLSTRTTPYDFGLPMSAPQGVSAYLAGGRVLVEPSAFVAGQEGQIELPVITSDPDLSGPDTLFTLPNPRGRLGGFAFAPFAQPPYHGVAPDGSGVAVADWSPERPGELRVRFLSPRGAELWSWSLELPPRPLGPALRDSVIQAGVDHVAAGAERMRESGVPEERLPSVTPAEAEAGVYIPDHLPPVRALHLGIDGTVWIQRADGTAPGPWVAFEADGTPLFQVSLPQGALLRHASRGWVWGVYSDELEVPHVVRWRVAEPDG